jgi:hypothetical protein
MKRFASHYLLIPAVGYMKQQVVEITDEGVVRGVFSLTEEIESVEWMPGVIVLLSESQVEEIKNTGMILKNSPVFQINLPSVSNQSSQWFNEYLQEAERRGKLYSLFVLSFLILLPCSLSTEHGTDYCGSNGYILRLGCLLACRVIGDI